MDQTEFRAQLEVARQLIEVVGVTPLVSKLIQQAEVEEAIAVLREMVLAAVSGDDGGVVIGDDVEG